MAEHEQPVLVRGPPSLGEFIRTHHSAILREWERAVRLQPWAEALSEPCLLNHMPDVLERVAGEVEGLPPGERSSLEESPEVHALDRLDVGVDLEQVTGEYALLRTCVLRLYRQHARQVGGVDAVRLLEEVERLERGFDEAVEAAVTRYGKARERTLMALDRIAEEALGTEDVDTFLPRLLRVLLETTEAVDSVALLLREGDMLRLSASVGLGEDAVGFSLKVGEGFEGEIAAERRSRELRVAATDPRVRSPSLRARGTRALHGVPLLHGEDVIGVAHMGSRTAYAFSRSDKLLFRAMTSRATTLLVQRQLMERERAAREELEGGRRLLRLVIEQSGDGIALTDEHGVLCLLNAEAERQHGARFRPVRAPGWAADFGLLSEDGGPLPLEEVPLYRALLGERVEGARVRVRRPDGEVRILSCSGAPLRRPDGSLAGAVLTTRDETDRLAQEARQAETLALLDALLAGAPAGVALLDTHLRYVRVNEVLAAANGEPMEAHLGRTVAEVLGERSGLVEPMLRRVLETGEPVRGFEFTGPSALEPGVPHQWMGDFFPVRAPGGEALGVAGILVDITARKHTEEALARDAAELEAILQSIPDGVYVGDASGISRANAAALEMLGFSSLEDLHQHIAVLGERLRNRAADTGRRLMLAEEPFVRALAGEAHVGEVVSRNLRTGQDVVVRCAAAPIRLGERIIGAVAVNTDITERKRQEEELRRTAEFRERFLGIVSHDLRNPLNAILLSANALLRAEDISERHLRSIRRVATSAERMVRMIGDLLDFTRGRLGGGIPINPQPMNLRHLVRHVMEELEVAYPERMLRLVGEGDFAGEWDPDRIAQLLGNLGKNALDYSPERTPVDLVLCDEGATVHLTLRNRGAPIRAELLPHLFEPFRRGEQAEQRSGLGLGLFIAREVVLAHGGEIEAHSEARSGTVFRVRLPRKVPGR